MTDGPGLADFRGIWRLEREIDDRLGGQRLRFEGTAEFVGDTRLVCTERGRMMVPGQAPMAAERVYVWEADGDGIAVSFDDGRFFHRIEAGQEPEARHDCDPDVYRVRYDFGGWPEWTAEWRVTGPRKDYLMVGRFARDD